MTNKHYISLVGILFFALASTNLSIAAAPPNDLCGGAIAIAVNGTCTTGQTTVDANQESFGSCVTGNMSVWYSLTLTGANNYIDVVLQNETMIGDVEFFLTEQTCGSISEGFFQCGDPTVTYTFNNLTTGATYLLMVSNATGDQGGFDICVTEGEIPGSSKPPDQPEQNCDGALTLCTSSTNEINSYQGFGTSQELSGTCLAGDETNSVWYVFTVQDVSAGTVLGLDLTIPSTDLYDFALYDITTIGCGGIAGQNPTTQNPVRCNWATVNGPKSLLTSSTSPTLPPLQEGTMGSPTMNGLNDVYVGQTFALIIDNWFQYDNGYTLAFTGTAKIYDDIAPTLASVTSSCTANTITLTISEQIDCSTIVQADFVLTNTTTSTDYTTNITSAVGVGCGTNTDQILFTHDGTLTSGVYQFSMVAVPGLADNCNNVITNTQTFTFNYLADLTLAATPTTLCAAGTVSLDANGIDTDPPGHTYTLNPGALTNTGTGVFGGVSVSTTTTYTVEVTYGGCTKTANATVTVEDNVVGSISPVDPQVCPAATTSLTATATINGAPCLSCNYQWSGASTQSDAAAASSVIAAAGAGTYNVVVTTPSGCTSTLTSSTVSEASGTPGTCNVYYVNSYNGATADGITKATPTSLTDALTKAACTNSTIKMQSGIYTFTNRVVLGSFITIEGGYPAGFTSKTSDVANAGAGTIIRRTNAADSDDANKSTAFLANNSTVDFELRNLRIELPGSANVTGHAAASQMSNYGVRMGTGCTGYSIVRCVIDAGVGSEP